MEERSYYSKDLGYVDTIQLGGIIILARIGDIRAYTYRFSLQSCFYEQMFAHLMVFSIIRRQYLTPFLDRRSLRWGRVSAATPY
jgi:hypothetical protein